MSAEATERTDGPDRAAVLESSVATVSLSGTLREKLAAAAGAGFAEVEIFEHDFLSGPDSPEEVRRLCGDLNLRINLFQPFRDFDSRDSARLAANLERARRKFELMRRLDVDMMLVCSHVGPDAVADHGQLAAQLHRLGSVAAEFGVTVAYEALAWGAQINDYRDAAAVARAADHPAVGTCLDSFHILSRGADPAGILEIPGDLIFFLQLADAPRMGMDVLQWSRHYRCFPGQGGLDVASVAFNALLAGYRGPLSLEVFNDIFRQAPAEQTARDAYRSLLFLQDQLRQRLSARRDSGVRAGAGELDDVESALLPIAEPPRPQSLAFVELDDEEGGPVADLIDRMGFARARTAEDATAWVHGDVWLATRPEAAARARISGLGLRVPDPALAADRAALLGSDVLEVEALGRPLPAVEAIDGTRITWAPLEPVGGGDLPQEAPGILGIDHVALTQAWDELDSATLFWTAVAGLDGLPGQDVPDPYGLVRSQAMRSVSGEVSVVLNVQPRRREETMATRREAPQHVAFETSDIVAAARFLADRGVPILDVGDNYWEDSQALFGLSDAATAELRDHRILIDEAGPGTYLQLFTQTVGGLFLELVERRGGYVGFGARNAPFRLAAQSRSC